MNKKSLFGGRKKVFLSFIFLFLLVLSVVAAQPTTTQTNINIAVGLQIQTQGIYYLEQDMNHTFSFHVYNVSTGSILDDTTTDCAFHLYNKTGKNQFDTNDLSFVAEGFEIELIGNNFSDLGTYSYYVHCNTTNYGGFARENLEVTPTGIGNLIQFYWIILAISAAILLLGFWLKDPWVVIFGTFGLYFIGLYILINGIVGIKDTVTTWAIGLIIIGIAAYISIKTAGETLYG